MYTDAPQRQKQGAHPAPPLRQTSSHPSAARCHPRPRSQGRGLLHTTHSCPCTPAPEPSIHHHHLLSFRRGVLLSNQRMALSQMFRVTLTSEVSPSTCTPRRTLSRCQRKCNVFTNPFVLPTVSFLLETFACTERRALLGFGASDNELRQA